jgi:WhiB family redox-sensing transcriptional regulator
MTSNKVLVRRISSNIEPARSGWEYSANCRGKDVLDFIYNSDNPSKKAKHKLKAICSDCPVLETCRLEAIRNREVGWWGGMDEKERINWAIKNLSK